MARRLLLALAAPLIAGCHAAAPKPAPPASVTVAAPSHGMSATAAAPSRSGSALHLVAAGDIGFETDPQVSEPCDVGGRTFVCGTSLAFDGKRFAAGSVRTPFGTVGDLATQAWNVVGAEDPPYKALVHSRAATSDWQVFPGLTLKRPGYVADELFLGSWWSGGVLVVEQYGDDTNPDITHLDARSYDVGAHAPPTMNDAKGRALLRVVSLASFGTGTVVAVGTRTEGAASTVAAVWGPGATQADVATIGDGRCSPSRHLAALGSNDIVYVGARDEFSPNSRPCGFHFDGQAWLPLALPAWGTGARSYVREPGGTEWVVLVDDRGPRRLSVWRREPRTQWTKIALPRPDAEGGEGSHSYLPDGTLWARQDGDVWVDVVFANRCNDRTFALFHTQPVAHVCRVHNAESRCFPMRATDALGPSCTPARYAR